MNRLFVETLAVLTTVVLCKTLDVTWFGVSKRLDFTVVSC